MEATQTIPDVLIYEMINGQPVYYKHYHDYLEGTKSLEEIMGSSYLQSDIVSLLLYALMSGLGKEYKVLTNELGLQLGKGHHRAADIAIIAKSKLKDIQDKRKYVAIPPDVVIEVDIKADPEGEQALSYITTKNEALFAFGVSKVLWILSDVEKIIVATPKSDWQIVSWEKEVAVTDDFFFNLKQIISEA